MKQDYKIQDFEELLRSYYDCNGHDIEYTTRRLTAPGENYGSLMLQVEITLTNKKSGKIERLSLVAKALPPNIFIQKMFNSAVTFKTETAIYTAVLPALRKFQRKHGMSEVIDCFAECYGARINLNKDSDKVDDNAVILLENLKLQNFVTVDRLQGFDLETAKILLKDLAVFHAVPVAMKLLDPEGFKKKILPNLPAFKIFDNIRNDLMGIIDFIMDVAAQNEECRPLIPAVRKSLEACVKIVKKKLPPSEPFATITHNDFWINNTMVKFDGDKPVKNKMIDFQMIDYGSPADDVIFFLFSSVRKEVLDAHYDHLIELYHGEFVETLTKLKCDITPFSFEKLLEELDYAAKTSQFFHVMFMLRPIYASKENVKNITELSEKELTDNAVTNLYRIKVPEMILEFVKRGWLLY